MTELRVGNSKMSWETAGQNSGRCCADFSLCQCQSVNHKSAGLFFSSLWSGSKHDSTKVPVVLAGGLGGALKTGRVLDYTGKSDEDRKFCSMYLSIMDRMGVKLDRFGDAETRLAGL